MTSDGTPTGGTLPIKVATPSLSRSPGSKDSFASRAAIVGKVPIGLTRISPSPRKASAIATAQYSCLATALIYRMK
jgi:hypothetical protein